MSWRLTCEHYYTPVVVRWNGYYFCPICDLHFRVPEPVGA